MPVVADDQARPVTVILGHGAGSHLDQKTMLWVAERIRNAGAAVVRFNFLYRVQGRGMPDRMPVLVATYRAVVESVRERLEPGCLVLGGHSMGGRVASMLEAEGMAGNGLLLFGYPLHPPGQPEKLRDAHLKDISVPVIQFSGTDDPFCTQAIMERVAPASTWIIHWIEAADHSYSVRKSSGRSMKGVAIEIESGLRDWFATLPGGNPAGT